MKRKTNPKRDKCIINQNNYNKNEDNKNEELNNKNRELNNLKLKIDDLKKESQALNALNYKLKKALNKAHFGRIGQGTTMNTDNICNIYFVNLQLTNIEVNSLIKLLDNLKKDLN